VGRLVVVGSLNVDSVIALERHPAPGETVLGGDAQTFWGGKGANQAVAAARDAAPRRSPSRR
jgi:ribokinase